LVAVTEVLDEFDSEVMVEFELVDVAVDVEEVVVVVEDVVVKELVVVEDDVVDCVVVVVVTGVETEIIDTVPEF
jgi:hypothetical protein